MAAGRLRNYVETNNQDILIYNQGVPGDDTNNLLKRFEIEKYNSIIRETSAENKLPFINLLDITKNKDLADGLHPNSKGHEKIFLKVKDFLLSSKLI